MMTIEAMAEDIKRAYGTSAAPDYSFVNQNARSDRYDPVVRDLGRLFEVLETTDLNDDVSRSISINLTDGGLTVRLSLVGPYACVHTGGGKVLAGDGLADLLPGKQVASVLEMYNIAVLDEAALRHLVRIGNQQVILYAALISRDEMLD